MYIQWQAPGQVKDINFSMKQGGQGGGGGGVG